MQPLVGIIMGSKSDWDTMSHAADTLNRLDVPHEVRVVSAHRTPDELFEYAASAESRGLQVIIAGAGGAAHLAGVTAAKTALPVLGVPVESAALRGMDSLLSIVQMPAGVPVGTLAIGKAGAINAAILATTMIGNKEPKYRQAVHEYRAKQAQAVLAAGDPRYDGGGRSARPEPKTPALRAPGSPLQFALTVPARLCENPRLEPSRRPPMSGRPQSFLD